MLLSFDFLVILNLFVLLLWPVYEGSTINRRDIFNIILIILTVGAVVLDIIYLVLKGTGHA